MKITIPAVRMINEDDQYFDWEASVEFDLKPDAGQVIITVIGDRDNTLEKVRVDRKELERLSFLVRWEEQRKSRGV